MLVVFADNQALVALTGTTVTITTDPVALGRNSRATGITNLHTIFNDDVNALAWKTQISNDGVTWVNQGLAVIGINAPGTPVLTLPAVVSGVYVRLLISFSAAGGTGSATFDIHVNFDHT